MNRYDNWLAAVAIEFFDPADPERVALPRCLTPYERIRVLKGEVYVWVPARLRGDELLCALDTAARRLYPGAFAAGLEVRLYDGARYS